MPKWWPWGRTAPAGPKPAAPAVPRPEPSWHRLAAVQRTLRDPETTAHLAGFTASLTTSQDPRLTGPLDLLAAHADGMTVLGGVADTSGTGAPPPDVPAAPAHRSRTWGPSPTAVQRALRASTAPVQRAADASPPMRQIHPLPAVQSPDGAPHSMVEAPPPDDRRPLEVADVTEVSGITEDGPQPVDPAPPQLSPDPDAGILDSPSDSAAEETALPVVQRMASTAVPTHTAPPRTDSLPAPESVSASASASASASGTPDGARNEPSPPLRRLPAVEQIPSQSPDTAVGFSGTRPIPVLRVIDAPSHQAPPNMPAATGAAAATPATTVQRAPAIAEPVRTVTPTPTVHAAPSLSAAAPPAPSSAPPAPSDADLATHDPETPDIPELPAVAPDLPAVAPVPAVQRITVTAHRDPPPLARVPRAPSPPTTESPLARLQRLPVVDPHPPAPVAAPGSVRRDNPTPTVQRTPESPTIDTVADAPDTAAPEYPNHAPSMTTPETTWEPATPGRAASIIFGTAHRPAATPAPSPAAAAAAPTRPAGVLQRATLPVVRPTVAPTPNPEQSQPSAPQRYSTTTGLPAVQRATTGGRLMVLPPVRTDSGTHDIADSGTHGETAGEPTRSVLFESRRPVGLQRMFEHTPATTARPDTAPGPAFASTVRAVGAAHRTDPGDQQAGTPGPSYDPGTNTLTFASPVVQRQTDAAPLPPEPAPAPAPTASAAPVPAAAAPAAGGDVDELVNRLYDPLAARLRAELWLDRERAGVLMDLHR